MNYNLYSFIPFSGWDLAMLLSQAYKAKMGQTYLSYITALSNIQSIVSNGILCHKRAQNLGHVDISLQEVQDKRACKDVVVGETRLHQYANLYFDARNPMMFKRKPLAKELCVVRVDLAVLDIQGTIIADRNAASDYVRFMQPDDALYVLDWGRIFARDWRAPNAPEYYENKSKKCAEVLVMDYVPPDYLREVLVVDEEVKQRTEPLVGDLLVRVHSDIFFC